MLHVGCVMMVSGALLFVRVVFRARCISLFTMLSEYHVLHFAVISLPYQAPTNLIVCARESLVAMCWRRVSDLGVRQPWF